MNKLTRSVAGRVLDQLLPPSGQFHDRTAAGLRIVIDGWEADAPVNEILSQLWYMVKQDAPKLKDKLKFFERALRAGWGGSDFLRWMVTGGRWDDDPKTYEAASSALRSENRDCLSDGADADSSRGRPEDGTFHQDVFEEEA